jgi:hypothetical protein
MLVGCASKQASLNCSMACHQWLKLCHLETKSQIIFWRTNCFKIQIFGYHAPDPTVAKG